VRKRLEGCADFGGWTDEDAGKWWSTNGSALTSRAGEPQEPELTLTRRLDSPETQ
jgi:hypothetical protein